MSAFYSEEDVIRWEKTAFESIRTQTEALRKTGIPYEFRWQRLGSVAGAYKRLAMVAIARRKFSDAMGFFRKAMEMEFERYEMELAHGKAVDAGEFQTVLLAYATTDQLLISKMLGYYTWDKGVPESVYLGKIIKSLAIGDITTAQETLKLKKPRIEKMFSDYPACLQAMADKDQDSFQTSIAAAATTWAKRASRYEKGLSDSVCFIQGVGLVRLAEQVIGTRIGICNEHIPAELLR
jgi:hypothetical protein